MLVIIAVLMAVFLVTWALIGRAAIRLFVEHSRIHDRIRQDLQKHFEGNAGESVARLRDLEDLVDRLPQRWEEIKREASRLDGRARYAVTRAREELSTSGLADERLEDLAGELHLVDGNGVPPQEVPEVPENVAEVEQHDRQQGWRGMIRSNLR